MYRIAVNTAISFYRRERREGAAGADPEVLEALPAEPADDDGGRDALHQMIDALDELHRALVLLYLDGNSYAEIADVLGISETNIATKLSRLKQRFRRDAAAEGAS
jgi:RNA polymerase sigma-70 factor (ECF subfamily)